MPIIIERNLAFNFPDDWQTVAYDRSDSFYRRVVEKRGVQHVRGMDIVCRLPNMPERLQFIEVKDDRKRQIQAGLRYAELFITVMQKTAGTLAGLLLAERLQEASLHPHACLSQNPAIAVVLFLVEPDSSPLPEPIASPENALYRLARIERVSGLDQRLTAKLHEWGLTFALHNLATRPATDWQVRDLA